MLSDFFALALNNLKRRKLRSWLTMIGIFIGIAAVVALIGLGQGLQEAITGQFGLLSTDTLTIQNSGTGFGPPGSTVIEKLNEHDVEIIKKVNGVENVVTRWVRIGTIEFNKISKFHYIGDLPEDKTQAEIVYDSLNLKLNLFWLASMIQKMQFYLFTLDRAERKQWIGQVCFIECI